MLIKIKYLSSVAINYMVTIVSYSIYIFMSYNEKKKIEFMDRFI